ncbi:putative bifunctional diguanylate cyclase/phosphodiesterase [Hoeflea sp.]|uniref:putative bifunctional diguanylate cyclase/phosphodiesterase n=1 Tax=Hoeflea sp. TaxID=1940281 RepID=UPI003BB193EC
MITADDARPTTPNTPADKQSRRLIAAYKTAALLIMAVGLIWAPILAWWGQWYIAIANMALTVLAAIGWLLINTGRLNTAMVFSEFSLLVFAILYCLMFDGPSAEVPRVTHLYLLPLAMLGYFNYLRRKSYFQLSVTVASVCAFIVLSSTYYVFPFARPIADDIRSVGIWFNSCLATAMMWGCVVMIQREFTRPKGLALELRNAVRNNEMRLHFQPQVDHAGMIIGAEALLRWEHPKRGQVSPGEFIPVAEEAGLMPLLGGWVLREACRTLADWSDDPALNRLTLAVNVSASQFEVDDFESALLELVRVHGIDPARLKLELTESVIVHDLERTVGRIESLRRTGIGLSLDDFGTGYSSLSYLRRLPIDQLKIDRSFVQEALESERSAGLVRSIIKLGLDLGLVVLAEGIETPEQHAFLLKCGCDEFQGYLFGRPMPDDDLREHVRTATLAIAEASPDLLRVALGRTKSARKRALN